MEVSEVDVCNWAYEGKLRTIQEAVESGQNLLTKTDTSKRCGLHWACSSGKRDVVDYFLAKGVNVSIPRVSVLGKISATLLI